MSEIKTPEGWNRIDVEDEVQMLKGFERKRDGLVLSIEKNTTKKRYAASFLPRNFRQDNQVIRSYGNDGYLIESDSLEEVEKEAQEWMEENSKG